MFYTYHQNNSYGMFTGPAVFVIVEAEDYAEANERAMDIGLYFDGAGDCSCCGNRWYRQSDYSEGTAQPMVGERIVTEYSEPDDWYRTFLDGRAKYVHIYYKDRCGQCGGVRTEEDSHSSCADAGAAYAAACRGDDDGE